MTLNENEITFDKVVNEDMIFKLKELVSSIEKDELILNLKECKDIHTVVIQYILSLKLLKKIEFKFPENSQNKFIYQLALEGFFFSEDDTN